MKAWIGVDPGKTGAMALLTEKGTVGVCDWEGIKFMHSTLGLWKGLYHIVAVAMEDTPAMRRDSKQSATTFQQHCGMWKALIILAGFEPVMVRPLTWMKRRIPSKAYPQHKPSVQYVMDNYPGVDVHGPMGGLKDGRSDAVCIAEWCKEQNT